MYSNEAMWVLADRHGRACVARWHTHTMASRLRARDGNASGLEHHIDPEVWPECCFSSSLTSVHIAMVGSVSFSCLSRAGRGLSLIAT
jgi:hypothetical protein